ncbi:MAG: hypothetical protein CVV64_04335 [Candidatus Wallbacteria bacterium HGW-Wallbacteria-1]|jgi:hypothetical protein|uniref:Yeast cell wall synthesis Kre9/Knh1-like N-terminal domain-containing protein n=1 Tax=Candidatus Wallbacteria bacterium HGW-Wallbacteria-1 TaxID=2013854 RepID=A0A2N1PRP8_9BACT|nr:MAG: hypothetical protein CVV64_04335 [Candidatus Wallbacteria bacterium HGW-Wallbacteria-1]
MRTLLSLVAVLTIWLCCWNPVSGNAIPALTILDPDGINDIAYDSYTIKWIDDDPDNLAQINLFYTLTKDAGDMGTPIIFALSEESTEDSYVWRTDSITPGNYYIRGEILDGVNPVVSVKSPGRLTIVDDPSAPFIILHEPDGSNDVTKDTFRISWSDFDADSDATISLFMDSDAEGFNGVSIISGISENSEINYHDWNVSTIPSGPYWIYAVIDDGLHIPRRIYSPGPVNVNGGPSITITSPDGIDDWVSDSLTITWQDSDPDSDASISLFYDTDNTGNDGIPIASGISEDSTADSHIWNTSLVPGGKYWIYATISDGLNPAVTAYSSGPVIVDRRGSTRYLRVSNLTTASATITWSGEIRGQGRVEYGTTNSLGTSLIDGPGQDHFISLSSLLPATTYFFRISTIGDSSTEIHDNGGQLFRFTTLSELPQSSNNAFSGQVRNALSAPIASLPIFLWVERDTSADSPDPYTRVSNLLSTITSQTGDFSLNTVTLSTLQGSSLTLTEGDRIIISARSAEQGQASLSLSYSNSLVTTGLNLPVTLSDDNLTMNLQIRKGFNMVSIPATGAATLDSVWLLSKSDKLIAAYKFDRSSQTYQSCFRLNDSFLGSFALNPDESIFLRASEATVIPIQVPGRISRPRSIKIVKGYNLIALSWSEDIPLNPSTAYDTFRLMNEDARLQASYIWSAALGKYIMTLRLDSQTLLGETTPLEAGGGLFIKSASETLLTPLR